MTQTDSKSSGDTDGGPSASRRTVVAAAFRLLLETGGPVEPRRLSEPTGLETQQVDLTLNHLLETGDVRLDAQNRVVGVAGLSVTPDRHEIQLEGRTFWTWCAYDIVGIFGSLKASGIAVSVSPATGERLLLEFRDGHPASSSVVVFRPDPTDPSACSNTYENCCPNSNFFETAEVALAWGREHGIPGPALSLPEATAEAAEHWRPLVDNIDLVGSDATVRRLADAIAAAVVDIDERGKRVVVALYQLLADGDPVTPTALAVRAQQSEAEMQSLLESWPGVFWDEDGRVVGFWGLAIPEMAHRFQADGGRPMYAWCALDPFLIVPVIRRDARVESRDPITGNPISMTVTPDGVSNVSPPDVMVSFIWPSGPFDQNVVQTFCNYVHYFASRESAERWAAGRDAVLLLSASDAFQVGLRAWSGFRDERI